MTERLSDQEQRTWRGFLRLHRDLMASLARQLTESGISAADFEVLVNVSEAPDHRLRVSALAETMGWERSRLSHQLTRMEKRGLVAREECPSDARGAFVTLTAPGLSTFEAAAPGHAETIRRRLFAPLGPSGAEALEEITRKVLDGPGRADQPSAGVGVSNATTCSSESGM
ncbi:MarR family winged helix-turn-helix transcriptional regulator [Actinocorallia longicatena]|uniref:MarR family transcriptional regulator n=1 Tax=Actinocorallia longicatena TaxID=111803 RepID=A0ABP6QLV4_9ACTN